jgi:hypothetical protein
LGSEACSGAVARDRLPGDFSLHVRARLARGGETQRHEAFVQVSDRAVTMVGLTPLGTQAYTLTLDADGLDLDNRIGRHLGLEPAALFDAIARVWIVPRAREEASALPRSGERLLLGPEAGSWRYVDGSSDGVARVLSDAAGMRVVSPVCGYDARLVLVPRAS